MGQNDKIREAAMDKAAIEILPIKSYLNNHFCCTAECTRVKADCQDKVCINCNSDYWGEIIRIVGIIEGVNSSLVQKVLRLEDENEHLQKMIKKGGGITVTRT